MVDIPFADIRQAIIEGSDLSGAWWICRKSGALYRQHYYRLDTTHAQCADVRLPALYPEGVASQRRLFYGWLKSLSDRERARELFVLAHGDSKGTAYAVPCLIFTELSDVERDAYLALLEARIAMYAEGCLQALNSTYGRPRYRFATTMLISPGLASL